jgi:hypothetical protein
MKRKLLYLGALLGLGMTSTSVQAQTRYLDEVFNDSELTVTTDVTYGQNYEVLTGTPTLIDLKMDVYEPSQSVDTQTDRPLVIFVHTGNFLPIVINGGTTGTKQDSTAVELCKQWAKRGYVAASIDYRLGWNPLDTSAEGRRAGLLQAVYRSIIDLKTAVRYFKKDAATADTYDIDPNSIAVYGEGSGGYTVLAFATLDKFAEMAIPKFTFAATGESYIDTMLWGNIDGYGGMFNNDNHVGYDATVQLHANAGGALADTSWLEGNESPFVSFHAVRDGYAPFDNGIVIVPTTNENVVEVQGANLFMAKVRDLGVNADFANLPFFGDPYTAQARSLYGNTYSTWSIVNPSVTVGNNLEGLYPIVLPLQPAQLLNGGAPWQWWDFATLQLIVAGVNAQTGGSYDANQIHQGGLASNPNMSAAQGRTYIDTIQGYLLPRMMIALDLPGADVFSVEENVQLENGVKIFPNPVADVFQIELHDLRQTLSSVSIVNVMGQQVASFDNLSGKRLEIDATDYASGMYMLNVSFNDGSRITKRFMVK